MFLPGIGGAIGSIGSLVGGGAGGARPGEARRASDLIDDSRHQNRRIDQLGDIASDFIDAVDFPTFVSDLLEGVFRANLKVTKEQMVAYQELLKAATQSLAFFMKKIPPQESFAYLASNDDDNFSVNFPPDDSPAELTDKDGKVVARAGEEPEDATVKAKIMDATLAMAKEQRAMLREILLMGVTRLVVEKGVIRASVKFDFKATENIDRQDKAMVQDAALLVELDQPLGRLLRLASSAGRRAGRRDSGRHAELSVATTKSEGDTSVTANLTGLRGDHRSRPTTSIWTTSPRCTGRPPARLRPNRVGWSQRPGRARYRPFHPRLRRRQGRDDDRWHCRSSRWRGEQDGCQEFDAEIGSNRFYAWGVGSGVART